MARPKKQPADASPPTNVSETPSPVATLPDPSPSPSPEFIFPSEEILKSYPRGMKNCLLQVETFLTTTPELEILRGSTAVLRLMSLMSVDHLIQSRVRFHQALLEELLVDGHLKEEYRVVALAIAKKSPFMHDPSGLAGCLLQFACLVVVKRFACDSAGMVGV